MPPSQLVATYLNDHLAGSAAGIDLVTKMCSSYEGTEFGDVLDSLRRDIEADRAALEQVMETLGVTPDAVKQAGGWMLEKLSRIKLDEHVTRSEDLTRLMEAEALSLGIEGKLAGWRSLAQLSQSEVGVDLNILADRARDQRARLEPFRLEAARRAFTASS